MLRLKLLLLGTAALLAVTAPVEPTNAQDADWGCQVLLCAASVAPSWHQIPYCVPPMMKLITAMARPHFSWPICKGAGTGAPGFERYEACPAGFTVDYSSQGSDNNWNREPDLCIKSVNRCGQGFYYERNSCIDTITQPRPLKDQPYYFDIRQQSGKPQRFWFDLNK
ncbi:hypothetical protein QE369_000678 [Agrobacterium larrymoorei]|uniref:DUF3551 domain-containing protein n=1 Tax=Agrobacterium larrymoorei TaxID=160699 RepID=A0AAJ2B6W5_9HYPH|nr:hypothetical protein [Agrobacterium larrymoorei]MDR6100500.1 hypothetical protein [Agrobacterium larrymoorei]